MPTGRQLLPHKERRQYTTRYNASELLALQFVPPFPILSITMLPNKSKTLCLTFIDGVVSSGPSTSPKPSTCSGNSTASPASIVFINDKIYYTPNPPYEKRKHDRKEKRNPNPALLIQRGSVYGRKLESMFDNIWDKFSEDIVL